MKFLQYLKICIVFVVALEITTAAQAGEKIRVAVAQQTLWDTGVAMIVADREGYFAKEGLDVELRFMRSAPEIIQTMILGESDVAIGIGIFSVIGAYGKGAPIHIISAEMTGNEYYWYAKASSPINSLKDLGGRTVGHNEPGSAAHLSALALKDYSGVDVHLVMAGNMSDNLTQVLSGQIDVGYGLPPIGLDKIENGELKIVALGSKIPALRNLTLRVNAATTDYVINKRDVLMKLIRARTNAIEWMYDNPEESWKVFAEVNNIPESIARQVFNFYTKENLAPVPIKNLEWSLREAQHYNFISQPLTETQVKDLVRVVYVPRKSQ